MEMAQKKSMKRLVLVLIAILFIAPNAFADSSYVLPYPSFMPGSKFYTVSIIKERIDEFLNFGSFSRFTHNLSTSDKYLIEAKVLFEYRQFLLASKSLKKSNIYFAHAKENLKSAKQEGKNISSKQKLLVQAGEKHIEVMEKILEDTPEEFVWSPEKERSEKIQIHSNLKQSIDVRR